MKLRKILSCLIVLSMSTTLMINASAFVGIKQVTINYSNIKFKKDDKPISTVVQPIIIENVTYLPIESVEYLFNIDITWDDRVLFIKENSNDYQNISYEINGYPIDERQSGILYNHLNIVKDNRTLILYDINGYRIEPFLIEDLPSKPILNTIPPNIYFPVRALAEALYYNVNWNSTDNVVNLDTKLIEN